MKKEIKREYWSNGQPFYEVPFVNGKIHGLEKYWHDNGQLSYEIPIKNNIQCGARIVFKY